jgi:hypothetical protein
MIQFNINRFGKLVKWSLTNDKGFYLKQALQVFAAFALIFLYFTTSYFSFRVHGTEQNYIPCCVSVLMMIIITFVTGPSWLFYSMKGKHDLQTLLMLPASNFEKYLMRYSTWLILLPLYFVAFFAADLVQYLVNVLAGHEGAFVTVKMVDFFEMVNGTLTRYYQGCEGNQKGRFLHSAIAVAIWIHSVYALGGTFFRSRKFSWALTTVAFIALTMLWVSIVPEKSDGNRAFSMHELIVWDVIYLVWAIVNFWLSYRLFCRQQVIGKFVNL